MRVHPASVLAPVNNTPAQGRGQVTAFVQKFKFGNPRYDFNSPNEQCGMSYASFIENRYTEFSNRQPFEKYSLFFIPRNLLPSFRYSFAPSLMEAKRVKFQCR